MVLAGDRVRAFSERVAFLRAAVGYEDFSFASGCGTRDYGVVPQGRAVELHSRFAAARRDRVWRGSVAGRAYRSDAGLVSGGGAGGESDDPDGEANQPDRVDSACDPVVRSRR